MPKCNQCGADLMEGAKFCPSCGAKVEEQQQPKVPTCPQCGQEINPSAAFCPTCGFNLRQGGQAPAPQPAPQPAPVQQQPYPQQQPYYQPRPMPQGYNQNAAKPTGPLPLVRSLVSCIGIFLIYVLLLVTLVIPVVNGSGYNYFNIFFNLFNFSGVTNFAVMYRTLEILLCFLPLVGFLSFGTIALISGIQGLIRKDMPKYGTLGYAIGFYAVFFVLSFGTYAQTSDIAGFSIPGFTFSSPAFILFFVTFLLYLMIGVAGSFLNNRIIKKSLAAPILRAAAAVVGIVLFLFINGATVATVSGTGSSANPMFFYSYSNYLLSSSSEYSSLGSFMLIHGIIYMMSVIYCGMSFGELFAPTRRKAYRLSTIIFTGVSSILSILSVAFYYVSNGFSEFVAGMPSICGFFVLFLAIAYMVLANIAANKEVVSFRRPMPMPPYQNYQQ